jgi:hypothetical protein
MFQDQPEEKKIKKGELILKISNTKKGQQSSSSGRTPVPSKYEGLSSNPSMAKKQTKGQELYKNLAFCSEDITYAEHIPIGTWEHGKCHLLLLSSLSSSPSFLQFNVLRTQSRWECKGFPLQHTCTVLGDSRANCLRD